MAKIRPRCALPTCQKRFTQARSDQRFCDAACRNKAHRMGGKPTPSEQPQNGREPVDYTPLARMRPQAPDPSTRPAMSNEEYLKELEKRILPNGVPPALPVLDPVIEELEDMEVTIYNVPTRFPGTPLSRGRQF